MFVVTRVPVKQIIKIDQMAAVEFEPARQIRAQQRSVPMRGKPLENYHLIFENC
jgi:hypothetical protein